VKKYNNQPGVRSSRLLWELQKIHTTKYLFVKNPYLATWPVKDTTINLGRASLYSFYGFEIFFVKKSRQYPATWPIKNTTINLKQQPKQRS